MLLGLEYVYDERGLIDLVAETDPGAPGLVDYEYDNRGRLISEVRTGTAEYNISYTYDQGGNRLLKTATMGSGEEAVTTQTVYHYDTDSELLDTDGDGEGDTLPAEYYQHRANRLMNYEVFVDGEFTEQVTYHYDLENAPAGNVEQMVWRVAGETQRQGTCLGYDNRGEVEFVTEKSWEVPEYTAECALSHPEYGDPQWSGCCEEVLPVVGGGECCVLAEGECEEYFETESRLVEGEITNEQVLSITEFRGSGRQRYLTRQRDPNNPDQIVPGSTVWTSYDGDEPYYDYTVDAETGAITVTKSYELGLGQIDAVTGEASYFHSDHLGTTRLITDSSAASVSSVVYTAFGERVPSPQSLATRYGYVGAYGYESFSGLSTNNSPLSTRLLHVGARTYDPSLGRFLQRDPIGIHGGLIVYEYVDSNPIKSIDPEGLWPNGQHDYPDWPGSPRPPYPGEIPRPIRPRPIHPRTGKPCKGLWCIDIPNDTHITPLCLYGTPGAYGYLDSLIPVYEDPYFCGDGHDECPPPYDEW